MIPLAMIFIVAMFKHFTLFWDHMFIGVLHASPHRMLKDSVTRQTRTICKPCENLNGFGTILKYGSYHTVPHVLTFQSVFLFQ